MLDFIFTNELLFIVQILVSFLGVILMFRFFGRVGLYAWIAFISVYANIEVGSFCQMFGLWVSLGNISIVSVNLCQDILSENYNKELAKKSVSIGLLATVSIVIISWISMCFNCPVGSAGGNHDAFCQVFNSLGIIVASSMISYFCSNRLNVFLYSFIKKYTKRIWIRAQFSTWISQLFDSFFFTGLCILSVVIYNITNIDFFNSQFPTGWRIYLELSLTTYIIKLIVSVFEIPFMYWAKRLITRNKVRDIVLQ